MNIAIVGSGNVAYHLYRALIPKAAVSLINSRSLHAFPENPDVVVLCVTDDAISEVASKIGFVNSILVHTSGAVSIDILAGHATATGVFYPLQTFSKNCSLNYSEIPIFLEASSPEALLKLEKMASLFSNNIRKADSLTRKHLHLASVFACNFTNAIIGIGADILKKTDIDFSVLIPLLKQTINKIELMSPEEAQTGPAKRGDSTTMANHLELLSESPELSTIYKALSNIIQEKAKIKIQ